MSKLEDLDYSKLGGLVPAVVQESIFGRILMVGFMNEEAVKETVQSGKVTFYSRSKKRLWVKGEESGNFLKLKEIAVDCDNDTLLVIAEPEGPTCHTGATSCFGDCGAEIQILSDLENVIKKRAIEVTDGSYTARLLEEGLGRIAQKVGEEGVEVALASVYEFDAEKFSGEVADLFYHVMVLLEARGLSLSDVFFSLSSRKK